MNGAAQAGTLPANTTNSYTLTANGLSDGLKLCLPAVSAANFTFNGVGVGSGAAFTLYSATNVATPFDLWTSVQTNQFDRFGVFNFTNGHNPGWQQQYFRVVEQ